MRKNMSSIATGAFITTISLFLLTLAYPRLFALFGLLFVTACIVLGLSMIASIPKAVELVYEAFRKRETARERGATCGYCGLELAGESAYCPNCGASAKKGS